MLIHPDNDILMERNVDTSFGIKDNCKVLICKNNRATKEDPGLRDYCGGNYGFIADALVYKK